MTSLTKRRVVLALSLALVVPAVLATKCCCVAGSLLGLLWLKTVRPGSVPSALRLSWLFAARRSVVQTTVQPVWAGAIALIRDGLWGGQAFRQEPRLAALTPLICS